MQKCGTRRLTLEEHAYRDGAGGSSMVKALCYKPDSRGFDTRSGEFLYSPNPSGHTRPWGLLIYSSSNRNEYQKRKNNNASGE
jgi:hypothetical protein